MLIAGEASGDVLGAELVKALRTAVPDAESSISTDLQPLQAGLEPRFFGAGGPRLSEAGVELVLDLTTHSVVGLSGVLRKATKFVQFFLSLRRLALSRQPDAILCIDYAGFNLQFAKAIHRHVVSERGTFGNWNPKIVQYVSPQVWASRPWRAGTLERSVDLLLSIFPFEKEWYARHRPKLPVEFVGHPLVDRYGTTAPVRRSPELSSNPLILLLPGSRPAEVKAHLPVLAKALQQITKQRPSRHLVVLPNERLRELAQQSCRDYPELQLQVGGLAPALAEADLAIACSGTVTMECAWFGVPTVVLYKTSWSTYQIAKRIVNVRFLAMPNLLANEALYPEFIQDQATSENLAHVTLELLSNYSRRSEIKAKLQQVAQSLGPPGACQRAAQAITKLLCDPSRYQLKAALE